MKKWLFLGLGLPLWLSAQHQIGWRTDAFAGINGALINPALPATTPYAWDVNLVEGAQFLTNNYVYFVDASLPGVWRGLDDPKTDVLFRDNVPQDLNSSDGLLVYDYVDDDRRRYGQVDASVMGPSFSVRIAPRTRVGLVTRWRGLATTRDVDTDFSFYRWRSYPDFAGIPIEPLRMAAASWAEVGLNFSQQIPTASGRLTLGATVKSLWGQRAAYFISEEAFDIAKLPENEGVQGSDFQIRAGFSDNISEQEHYTASPGRGFSADLGLLYEFGEAEGFYRWTIGASLLDLGRLRFAEGQEHLFNTEVLTTALSNNYQDMAEEMGVEMAVRQFSQDVYADSLASRTADEISLGLPTTAGLQVKYAFNEAFSVHTQVILNAALGNARLERMGLLAVTPRFDRYWWSVALPVSYYAGHQLRVGMALRLGPLFFGADQLGSLLGSSRLQGGDFYAGLKIHPFGLRAGERSGRNNRRSRGKDVECYRF